MLKKITKKQQEVIGELLSNMSIEEKASQVLCWNINNETPQEIEAILAEHPLGSVFIPPCSKNRVREIVDCLKGSKIPIIVSGDLENGAGSVVQGDLEFPMPMAASATNDPSLIKTVGLAAASQGRARGFHWTLAPIVDLALNYNNPITGVRALGDSASQVIKMAKPYIEGIQDCDRMAACCKHFPGDGDDDRDQHFCTSVNSLSKEEWHNSYGRVWKEVIKAGTMTIMPGHIALPFQDSGKGYKGAPPATLSKKIQIDLLRTELGFDGLIVSDAISMVGINSHVKADEVAVKNIAAGSDMVLFGNPKEDTQRIIDALKNKKLSMDRIDDAVRRVLELKARVGLLDGVKFSAPNKEQLESFKLVDKTIAEKSITLIRNEKDLLPLTLKKGDKVLTVTIGYIDKDSEKRELPEVDKELQRRGFKVTHLVNPKHTTLLKECSKYKAVFINISIIHQSRLGTTRMTGELLMSFWRAFWVNFDHVVFTSFGSPYHLYELPAIPNYTNVYSNAISSQKAAVAFWLGDIKATGISPIMLNI